MKALFIIGLLLLTGRAFCQDWSITTTNRTRWTSAGIDGEDTVLDTSYRCRITKKGNTITFTIKNHKKVLTFREVKGFPSSDEFPHWLDLKKGPCICYYTLTGQVLYYPKRREVIRQWPQQWKYDYF